MDAGGVFPNLRVEARDRKLEGVLELLLQRGVIANGGAALYAAGGRYGAGLCQQRFSQAGLAAARLADEREGPDALDGMSHGASSSPPIYSNRPRPAKARRKPFPDDC